MAAQRNTKSQHKESVGFLLVALLVLALVAALATFGIWYWQQQEVNRLNQNIDQLKSDQAAETNQFDLRIAQLEKDLAAAIKAKEEAQQPPAPQPQPAGNEYTSPKGVVILVDTPEKNAKVTSPLKVSGQVPGTWSFEASFGVRLLDGAGNTLAQAPAQLQGDWMTTELVSFEVTLTFTSPGSGTGQLVLIKDNPSGMPDKDDSLAIPIKF